MASKNKCQIFYETPATLQQNAAAIVAVHLWRNEIVINNTRIRSLKNIHPRLKSSDDVKPAILEAVDQHIRRMKKTLIDWLEFHFLRVFYPHVKGYDIVSEYYDLIYWNIDSSIDFDRTAKNFMGAELDELAKFKMACLYCFEDDIRMLWPEVELDDDLEGVTLDNEPYLCYWITRMKNNSLTTELRRSMELDLIQGDAVITWSAMLFLYTNSSPGRKVDWLDIIGIMLHHQRSEYWAKNLLSLISEDDLELVIKGVGDDVMRALARSTDNMEYLLQMWRYMKNIVFDERFFSLLNKIGKWNSTREHLPKLLHGIWIETPDNFKKFAVEKHLDKMIQWFCDNDQYPLKNLARDINLLLELLSYKDLESRNRLWSSEWRRLVEGVNAANSNKLMKLCFKTDEEIAAFKKANFEYYPKIEYYCEVLVEKGYFDELDEFLHFCSPDPDVVVSLKKKIVWSEAFVDFSINNFNDCLKMQAFHRFVGDIYPERCHRINLLGQIVTSFWHKGYILDHINGRNINSAMNLVRSFFTRGNDLKKVKDSFKKICHGIFTKGRFKSFNERELNEVLLWSMNDNKAQMDQFKRSIPIEDVFQILFDRWVLAVEKSLSNRTRFEPDDFNKKVIEYYADSSDSDDFDGYYDSSDDESFSKPSTLGIRKDMSYDDLEDDFYYDQSNENNRLNSIDRFNLIDDFLTWYFGSKTKTDQFKMAEMKKYRDTSLKKVFASKNPRLIKVVLNSFFNDDAEWVKMFMKTLKF